MIYLTENLGDITVANAKVTERGHQGYNPRLSIITESFQDENGYCPAESVTILGLDNIKKLRNLCDKAIEKFDELNPAPPKKSP